MLPLVSALGLSPVAAGPAASVITLPPQVMRGWWLVRLPVPSEVGELKLRVGLPFEWPTNAHFHVLAFPMVDLKTFIGDESWPRGWLWHHAGVVPLPHGEVIQEATGPDWALRVNPSASGAPQSGQTLWGDPALNLTLAWATKESHFAHHAAFEHTLMAEFRRGDADSSGEVSAVPDALFLLRWQFVEGADPACEDAADVNDNGTVSGLWDSLYLLRWYFAGGDAPSAPGSYSCGRDPRCESDDLGCEATAEACR